MSQIGTSPLDSTVKVSDPAKQVAADFDGGSVDASFETGDGCVIVGDGCVTVGDGCVTVGDGCVTVGDGCVTVGDGCVTVGWDGEGNATVGVLGVGGDVVCAML